MRLLNESEENAELNAYITLNKEEAIERAKELEEKEVGEQLVIWTTYCC